MKKIFMAVAEDLTDETSPHNTYVFNALTSIHDNCIIALNAEHLCLEKLGSDCQVTWDVTYRQFHDIALT